MRSKGEADRRRRAASQELIREASISYRRSRSLDERRSRERETQELAEEVATSVFDLAEDPQVLIGTGANNSSSLSSVMARGGGNNPVAAQDPHDITIFDQQVKHILQEFNLGHEATSPIALKLANQEYENISDIMDDTPDEIMKWTTYYDGTTTKVLSKRKMRKYLHTYMYIMKRILIDNKENVDIMTWTKANFDYFCQKLTKRVICPPDLIADIERHHGANQTSTSPKSYQKQLQN